MSKKTIGVYLDKDIHKKLIELADKENRSISNYVTTIIEGKIKERESIEAGNTQIDPAIIRKR